MMIPPGQLGASQLALDLSQPNVAPAPSWQPRGHLHPHHGDIKVKDYTYAFQLWSGHT